MYNPLKLGKKVFDYFVLSVRIIILISTTLREVIICGRNCAELWLVTNKNKFSKTFESFHPRRMFFIFLGTKLGFSNFRFTKFLASEKFILLYLKICPQIISSLKMMYLRVL